eukprot:Hpha_TRINITY_DN16465_c1_g14::TRINITY_DN16465_c1_g14_i1::g.160786::m.160786
MPFLQQMRSHFSPPTAPEEPRMAGIDSSVEAARAMLAYCIRSCDQPPIDPAQMRGLLCAADAGIAELQEKLRMLPIPRHREPSRCVGTGSPSRVGCNSSTALNTTPARGQSASTVLSPPPAAGYPGGVPLLRSPSLPAARAHPTL